MVKPTQGMREEARRGLEWRREFNRGGTAVGVARARDIVNNKDLSLSTIRRMKSYFARHEVDKKGEGFSQGEKGYPSAGRIAWALWGGNAGKAFANKYSKSEDDERMLKRAAPDGVAVGDFVSWNSSGGRAYGKVRRIVRDGTLNVPDTDFTLNATEDDPAALIMLYRKGEDGYAPTGQLVGHKFSTLTVVSERSEDRHIKNITETETEVIITFGKSEELEEDDMAELEDNAYGKHKKKDKDKYREARPAEGLEVREIDDGLVSVEGYAAVFDSPTIIAGKWQEQIARGAFTEAVGRDDVVFLINHAGLPLARTRSGTLELSEDERGLKVRANLDPSDPDVRSILPKMKRGDLDKMSFAFVPTGQEWSDEGDMPTRTITRADLHDVSIVTTPAYESTSIGLRSALSSLESYRKARHAKRRHHSVIRRLKMKAKFLPK